MAEQGSRDRIMGSIRRALRRGPLDDAQRAVIDRRLSERPRGPIPERAQLDAARRLDLFQRMAEEVAATVERLDGWHAVPGAAAEYLRAHNRPSTVRIAPHPDLTALDWAGKAPMLTVDEGPGDADIPVGVSRALAGVAETGTLLLRSGPDSPTTLNFLPATHIVVLNAADVVGPFEDAWDRLREETGARGGNGAVPRTVNLVTGPSRTADIEQTLQLGAHGPMDLHILIVGHVG